MNAACRFCGSGRGFREVGRARCPADRKTQSVEMVDGEIRAKWCSIEVDDFEVTNFEGDEVRCRECGATGATLNDLVGAPVNYAPGDVVTCPDEFRGTVASVDHAARTLTVEHWHEAFSFAEVTPPIPVGA